MLGDWLLIQAEYLKTHRKGDETMPIGPDDEAHPEDPRLPALLPLFSAPAGAGVIWALVPDERTGVRYWKKQVWFAGEAWTTGKNRVYWWLGYNEKWKRASLIVVVAPEVDVWIHNIDDESNVPPQHPRIEVFRVNSADQVPALGSPWRIQEIIGLEQRLVNGVEETAEDLLTPEEQSALRRTPPVALTVFPMRNRVLIRQSEGHWSIDLHAGGAQQRQGFAHDILPVYRDDEGFPVITVRVLHTSNVRIDVTRADRYLQSVLAYSETITRLRFETKAIPIDHLPEQGEPIGELVLNESYRSVLSDRAVWWGKVVETAVGFVPIVGALVDVAHLTYMSSSGETFWGERVQPSDMFVQGLFTLVGVVASADDAVRLVGIAGDIFPGARVVSANPGLVPSVRAAVVRSCDQNLLTIVQGLSPAQRAQLIDGLVAYLRDHDLAKLLTVFDQHIGTPFRMLFKQEALPEGTLHEALLGIHPSNLPSFNVLDEAVKDQILEIVNVRGAPRAILSLLTGPAAQEFSMAVDIFRIEKAFNPSWGSFRIHLLATGFRKYGRRGGRRNAVQWAVALSSNNKYWEEFVRLLGEDYKDVLRRTVEYWQMPATAVRQFANRAIDIGTYDDMREMMHGVGKWIQVDHVIEQRFYYNNKHMVKATLDTDQAFCVPVPVNAVVADILNKAGVQYAYVHSDKTHLLAQIIPHGAEYAVNLSQVFDAHLLVMKHQLGLPAHLLDSLLLKEFEPVARDLGLPHLLPLFRSRMADSDTAIRLRLPWI